MGIKCIYLAGRFSAKTSWQIELNIRHAEEVALKICLLKNCVALVPHSMYRYFYNIEELDERYWYEVTMEMMKRCDAILMLNDWELSKGAVEEYREAVKKNMPVFFENKFNQLEEWINNGKASQNQ